MKSWREPQMTIGSQFFLTRSAFLALRSDSSFSPIVVETKELIWRAEEDNIVIDLCWVPGHVNVRGNEKADAAAKDATLRVPTAPHKAITNGWHREWNSLARDGRQLREIKKDVKDWTSSHNKSRRIETVLAWGWSLFTRTTFERDLVHSLTKHHHYLQSTWSSLQSASK